MLERNVKPLPSPLAGALLVLGFVALLPWRATARARPISSLTSGGMIRGAAPRQATVASYLDDAAKGMLSDPSVRRRVGWTSMQDAVVEKERKRWQNSWNAFTAELYARQRSMTLRALWRWDAIERPKAVARADAALGPYPWTPEQERTLRMLALTRWGGALWKDPEVASRLHLTPDQIVALTKENGAIRKVKSRLYAMPVSVAARPMPPKVEAEIKALKERYLVASPAERRPLTGRLWALRSRFQPIYSVSPETLRRRRAEDERLIRLIEAMRRDADRRLMAKLTDAQRITLHDLETRPEAWNAPVEIVRADGLAFNGQNVEQLPTPKRSGAPIKVVLTKDGSVLKVYRDGTKTPHWYRIDRVPPPSNANAPQRSAPIKNAIPAYRGPGLTASNMTTKQRRHYFSENLVIDGRPASALPDPIVSGDPIKVVVGKDGTGWQFYRKPSHGGLYRYEIERIKPVLPIKPRTPAQAVTPAPLFSRWSGLTIDGPPPGDEPGNVPIGVARDPDGSVWTVYRARQSAPYTYSVEHRTPARGLPRMLDYQSGAITSELRRRALSDRLPATLQVDGKVWAIQPALPKRSSFPAEVEPLDHHAHGVKAERGT